MANVTITGLTAVTAGNLTDAAVLAVDDANVETRKATVAQLWTALAAQNRTFAGTLTVSGLITANAGITLGASQVITYGDGTTQSSATTSLDALSDVVITTAAANQILYHNGTNWVNTSTPVIGGAVRIATNNTAFQGTTTGGATRDMIAVNSNNDLQIYAASRPINLDNLNVHTSVTGISTYFVIKSGTTHYGIPLYGLSGYTPPA